MASPAGVDAPALLASRHEGDHLPTVVTYGHGDAVRGYDDQWDEGLEPWKIVVKGDRWYGRGIADNKGQHSVNFTALEAVIGARGGKLGYNVSTVNVAFLPSTPELLVTHHLIESESAVAHNGCRDLIPTQPAGCVDGCAQGWVVAG